MPPAAKPLSAKPAPREIGKPFTLDRQLGVVRYSPCGKFLLAGDFEGQVCRWDSSGLTLTPLPALTGHHGWVQTLAFHPDGKRVFSADSWGQLMCWPFSDKSPKATWSVNAAHDGWIRRVAVSPDGKTLASCGRDGLIRFWDCDKGEKKNEWAEPGADIHSLAFHPDGKSLVSGDLKGVVKQRELATAKVIREFDAKVLYFYERIQDVGGVRCLAFDKTGANLAVCGGQPSSGGFVQGFPVVLFFETATGKLVQNLKIGTTNDGYVLDGHWHPAGYFLAVTSGQPGQGKFLLHQPGEAQPFFITPKMANCHSLALHPNGTRLVVSATNGSSAGNGRPVSKDKEYPGNYSPLFVWELLG